MQRKKSEWNEKRREKKREGEQECEEQIAIFHKIRPPGLIHIPISSATGVRL